MKKLLLFLAVIVLLGACDTESSDDVAVSAIWQSYYYQYDKVENTTSALAEFRDGGVFGNDVILVAPSGIVINGNALVHQNWPYYLYYHYYKTYNGKVMTGTYVFTDKNSKTYTNVADLTGMDIDFPASLDTIPKSEDLVIFWEGDAIGTDETVEVSFFEYNDTTTLFTISNDQLGDTSITISIGDLAGLNIGLHSITLDRMKDLDLQAATAKGGVMIVDYTTTKNCEVID